MKIRNLILSMFLLIAFLPFCKKVEQTGETEAPAQEVKEKVKLDFYVMSQCPFGVQVLNTIKPVLDKMGRYIDFNVNFIGDEPSPGNLTSMHGENEVKGDILQICSKKVAPDKYMNFIFCLNKNAKEMTNNLDSCAKEAAIDPAPLKACYEGAEGKQLLSESFKKAKEVGARGSPTIKLNNAPFQGGRQELDFMRSVCNAFTTAKPEECKNIPEPKKINMTVLSDKRCKDAMPDRIVGQLKNMMPGLIVKNLDYSDAEGKALYDSLKDKGVQLLPAFLFGKEVTEDPGSQQVQRFLVDAGDYKNLKIGAKCDPSGEYCDNKVDDNGDGKVDCDDPKCAGDLLCRKDMPKKLDLFIMSQCPYGVKALDAMKEVLNVFKDINFNIHFIADETPQGFQSLHGQGEVDENIRELCAIKYYPKNYKYMDYMWCRNKDIRSAEWQKCATKETGIDAKVIEKCATGDEGKKLLSEDIKNAKELNVSGSPSWFANNKYKFSALAPEQIRSNLCLYNKDLKGCEQKLSGDSGPAPAGGCGGN